jgi:hypothetical protein
MDDGHGVPYLSRTVVDCGRSNRSTCPGPRLLQPTGLSLSLPLETTTFQPLFFFHKERLARVSNALGILEIEIAALARTARNLVKDNRRVALAARHLCYETRAGHR